MTTPIATPFDTIESAHDFVMLLSEVVEQAKQEVDKDLQLEANFKSTRHRDALLIASYNLTKLQMHMKNSGRILNDLRSLRRLLYAERKFHRVKALGASRTGEVPALPNSLAAPKPPVPCRAMTVMSGSSVPTSERAIPA